MWERGRLGGTKMICFWKKEILWFAEPGLSCRRGTYGVGSFGWNEATIFGGRFLISGDGNGVQPPISQVAATATEVMTLTIYIR